LHCRHYYNNIIIVKADIKVTSNISESSGNCLLLLNELSKSFVTNIVRFCITLKSLIFQKTSDVCYLYSFSQQ